MFEVPVIIQILALADTMMNNLSTKISEGHCERQPLMFTDVCSVHFVLYNCSRHDVIDTIPFRLIASDAVRSDLGIGCVGVYGVWLRMMSTMKIQRSDCSCDGTPHLLTKTD